MNLDQQFWNSQWKTGKTGWDINQASPPITEFVKTLVDKELRILIPGCGNAHEALFLIEHGFTNITLIDIAPEIVKKIQLRFKNHETIQIICEDFFNHIGSYDLIIEQTFFCAISPTLRSNYVKKMHQLLNPNGKLIGVLFNRSFNQDRPPFGGNEQEYKSFFNAYFNIHKMETCRNSILPRKGNELFIHLIKKRA